MLRLSSSKPAAVFLLLALAGCNIKPTQSEPPATPQSEQASGEIGLFTTLPIYWGEGGDISSILEEGERGWVRGLLEEDGVILPLDTLEAFRDHGKVVPTLTQDVGHAEEVVRALGVMGIGLNEVGATLSKQGVDKFAAALDGVLETVDERRRSVVEGAEAS